MGLSRRLFFFATCMLHGQSGQTRMSEELHVFAQGTWKHSLEAQSAVFGTACAAVFAVLCQCHREKVPTLLEKPHWLRQSPPTEIRPPRSAPRRRMVGKYLAGNTSYFLWTCTVLPIIKLRTLNVLNSILNAPNQKSIFPRFELL